MSAQPEVTAQQSRRHQVVIIGSGFGGLTAAKKLKRADVDIKLIARTTHHLFQPLLYQVATGILSEGEIAPSTRVVLRKQRNAQVLLGDVTHIDLAGKFVTSEVLGHTYDTPFDSLIVAAGAGQSYFGNDQFAEFAPGMKTIDDANRLRSMILGAFELAEAAGTAEERLAWMTFAIVGAGPTGVEMAGQVAELAQRILTSEYRSVDTSQARIVLLDSNARVLKTFPERLSARAKADLEFLGIDVRLGVRAVGIDPEGLDVKIAGEPARITAKTVIWAAGVKASPLGAALGVEVDGAGRVVVEPT
jgi:NADH dehydrogenase